MKLAANPNRMELLRLRRRLALAERGHKLLEDKLEEMMRRFLDALRRLAELRALTGAAFGRATLAFALARGRQSPDDLDASVADGTLDLAVSSARVLNIEAPRFETLRLELGAVDLRRTEAELDAGLAALRRAWPLLAEEASLRAAAERLAREIGLTRRRVNALEHVLIPGLRETIRAISARLEEIERATQVQLLRVKDIVRNRR